MNKSFPTPKRIPFTKSGYQKLLDEKAKFLSERPDAVKHLSEARNMGDLSENGYYKAARARLSSIDANLRRLERLIRLGRIVESQTTDTVGFGNTVTISDGAKSLEFTVVGGYESNPAKSTISHLSPIGKALLNKKIGDHVEVHTPSGLKRYTIQSIR